VALSSPHQLTTDALVERLFHSTLGAMELLSVYLGDRLGLYEALADGEPATPGDLATRTTTDPRYIREWLEHQAVSGFLTVDDVDAQPDQRRYRLPEDHRAVLADPDNIAFMRPLGSQFVGITRALDDLLDAYRTGSGVPFERYGDDMRRGIAEGNRVLFINQLGSEWFPAMPDICARLDADPPARVADVGCGSGWSSIAIARAFPKVKVDGLDLDEESVKDAKANVAAEGLGDRVQIEVRDAADPDLHGSYDFACAFECIHDMAKPVEALAAMRNLVGPGGSVLIADERVADRFIAPGDEIERLMYGFSILHCLPVGLVDTPSAATGTVMRPDQLREYATAAGFREMTILPVEHDVWRFYRLDA